MIRYDKAALDLLAPNWESAWLANYWLAHGASKDMITEYVVHVAFGFMHGNIIFSYLSSRINIGTIRLKHLDDN